jgi:hypothetical protein
MFRAMAEEPIAFLRVGDRLSARTVFGGGEAAARRNAVRFDRRELAQILRIYGRMVAAGAWRDYALDFLSDRAVFSVYRRASDVPLYTIEKQPALKARQGQYAVYAVSGHLVRRGRDLAPVLRYFDRKLLRALEES